VKIGESHIAKNYVRNLHLMEQQGFIHQMIALYWRRKLDKQVKQLDTLVLLTQHDADSWSGLTKTMVIPNSLPFFPEKPSTCNQKQVIFVGRLNEQKGLEYLIDTWERVHQKHNDWILQIYGDGEQRELLHHLISEARLENSVVVNQPTRQIMDKYLESSIFLLTSRFEGFGMVLIEAMACGVPVVSFDCPWGPADIIKNGEDGFLVDYLNTDEAAHRVCQLIEKPELRKSMGTKAHVNVQRYNRDAVMHQWMTLFDRLL
jgi:glycosyltransferase involved in cell wall biosynthesis